MGRGDGGYINLMKDARFALDRGKVPSYCALGELSFIVGL